MDKLILNRYKNIIKSFNYFFYRRKHLILYIFIGLISIYFENLLRNYLIYLNISFYVSAISALCLGILIAFLLNFFFNFNVPKYFFYRSLLYFFIISSISFLIQVLANIYVNISFANYEISRFAYSGVFFLIGYFFHINFSFRHKRIVGIAIYINKDSNINKIYNKIQNYPDFIHIDIVDDSMNGEAVENDNSKINEICDTWPEHKIDIHIMSKFPSKYINKSIKNINVIYFHSEIEDSIDDVIRQIKNIGAEPGIVLHAIYDYKNLNNVISKFQNVLVLSIDKIGVSGQYFYENSYTLIKRLNESNLRKNFQICVDGGVKIENINKFNCEKIVSASNVLNSINPRRKIMSLQTLSRYEKTFKKKY